MQIRNRQRPWLRFNRWFATQVKPTSVVCPDRDPHSTGERPSDPSDESHGSLSSSIRTHPSTHVYQRRILIGSHLESTWQIGVHHDVQTFGIQRRSICRPNLKSHLTHRMFLWKTTSVDRGTKPRALKSKERPSRLRIQAKMLAPCALARRLRSKRHDNAKEGAQTGPALQRSIEPLNTCHRSRNIAESPADTVGG